MKSEPGELKMAFKRILIIKIGPQPGPGNTYPQGVLISDLNVAFEVVRTIEFSNNECTLTIYNAKTDTINNILKKGNNVRIEAGYEDEGTGVIFIGNITSSNSVISGNETITNIKAESVQKSNENISYNTVSLSYEPGTALSQVVKEVAAILNFVPFGADITTDQLANGFSFAGPVKAAIYQIRKILKNYGFGLFVDEDLLIVHKIGKQDSRFKFAYLAPDTGLINAFRKDDEFRSGDKYQYKNRIEYKCLLNPNIVPNGLVTIDGKAVKGTFVNEKVTFKGDNFGGEFTVTGEAVAE